MEWSRGGESGLNQRRNTSTTKRFKCENGAESDGTCGHSIPTRPGPSALRPLCPAPP